MRLPAPLLYPEKMMQILDPVTPLQSIPPVVVTGFPTYPPLSRSHSLLDEKLNATPMRVALVLLLQRGA